MTTARIEFYEVKDFNSRPAVRLGIYSAGAGETLYGVREWTLMKTGRSTKKLQAVRRYDLEKRWNKQNPGFFTTTRQRKAKPGSESDYLGKGAKNPNDKLYLVEVSLKGNDGQWHLARKPVVANNGVSARQEVVESLLLAGGEKKTRSSGVTGAEIEYKVGKATQVSKDVYAKARKRWGNPGFFGSEAVAKAKRVTKVRRVKRKETGETGEIVGALKGGWLKVKWDNASRPSLIQRELVSMRATKQNPSALFDQGWRDGWMGNKPVSNSFSYRQGYGAGKRQREREQVTADKLKRNPDMIGKKIAQLVGEGYPQKQAVAVAFSEKRAGKINPESAYSKAASLGYPYIRGEGKQARDGVTWLSRFTKKNESDSPAIYVGWAGKARKWIIEKERKRKNPSVNELANTFQGQVSGAVSEYKAANSAPSDLARIGKLVFLKLRDVRRQITAPGAMVAVDTKGKLWLVSKRAPMFEQKASPGDRASFGDIDEICYLTAKAHIEKGQLTEYHHRFGENGGEKPELLIDDEGMPIIKGGDYQIHAEGIVN